MKRITTILLLSLITVLFLLSCNLDGAGIFLSMAAAEETASTDYSDSAVQNILQIDGSDNLFIRMGKSIKYKIYTNDTALWDEVTALDGLINDVEFCNDYYYFALFDSDTTAALHTYDNSADTFDKDIVIGDLTALGTPAVAGVKVSALFTDDTAAFAVYDDGTNYVLVSLDGGAITHTLTTSLASADSTVKANAFSVYDSGTSTSYIFINADDGTAITTYYATYTGGTLSALTEITNSEFTEHLIGGFSYSNILYLMTNDGNVFSFDPSGDLNTPADTDSILADQENDLITIGKTSAGKDLVRSSGVPTVLVNDGTDDIILVAGDEELFELNMTDLLASTDDPPTITPAAVEAQSGNYFNALSGTRILDFYDHSGSAADWEFLSSTSTSFILETTAEDAVSTIIP